MIRGSEAEMIHRRCDRNKETRETANHNSLECYSVVVASTVTLSTMRCLYRKVQHNIVEMDHHVSWLVTSYSKSHC